MKFSERYGFSVKKEIQIEGMDWDLRNAIWNMFYENYILIESSCFSRRNGRLINNHFIFTQIWTYFLHNKLDNIPSYENKTFGRMFQPKFDKLKWYEVYDFIEFVLQIDDTIRGNDFKEGLNLILERERSGYRIVNTSVIKLIEDCEIESIEELVNQEEYEGVKIHIKTALKLLAKRDDPDLRNSIKESISAVESICCTICDDDKLSLGKALKQIEKKSSCKIHPTLITAFEKKYGYTSDDDGIRHSLLEEDNLYYEDALYMLVSCSAFVNYLIAKHEKNSEL